MIDQTRKYRPSNGSEGEWFMSKFCERCVKDSEARPCRIIGLTMSLDISHKDYPRAWVEDAETGPRCTEFSDHKAPAPNVIRDKRQIGLPI